VPCEASWTSFVDEGGLAFWFGLWRVSGSATVRDDLRSCGGRHFTLYLDFGGLFRHEGNGQVPIIQAQYENGSSLMALPNKNCLLMHE